MIRAAFLFEIKLKHKYPHVKLAKKKNEVNINSFMSFYGRNANNGL